MELLLGILLTLVVLALAGIAAIALTRTPKPVDGQLLSMMDGLLDRIKSPTEATTEPAPILDHAWADTNLGAGLKNTLQNEQFHQAMLINPNQSGVMPQATQEVDADDGKEEDATDTI